MYQDPTIFALASGRGRAGVAVVRLSGPGAVAALVALTGKTPPPPRRAGLRCLYDPTSGEWLDQALVLVFHAPDSFTGEDVVELHLHGGRAVLDGVLGALASQPDCRLAEAGEFSRRAFTNDRLDLTQAEAIADLVDADTAAQRRQALRQLGGALGDLVGDWRDRLAQALAYLEADIDFVDESDIPEELSGGMHDDLAVLLAEIRAHLNDRHRGERLREGVSVAIIGQPNVGKSSLLNYLARRDVAIVSETAGTTRDVIDVFLDLGGYPVTLADTAGLRDAAVCEIEAEGMRRALDRAETADLKLVMFDSRQPPDMALISQIDADSLVLANKADLARPTESELAGQPVMAVSVKTEAGMNDLLARLEEEVARRFDSTEAPVLTRARHRAALQETAEALERAVAAQEELPELLAEDVRIALRALGRITGHVDVEAILDLVFCEFCVGK